MEEVSLIIDDQVFRVRRDLLYENSDYFRAMFSGNFVESYQEEIKIYIVDANSMKYILKYMENSSIDLSEYTLDVIEELVVDAIFLQVIGLIKYIERHLDTHINASNFLETMSIAETASYKKLYKLSASIGLLSFNEMRAEYIPSIEKLYWYLSHPYLQVFNELDVFEFGLQWILHAETGADALLMLLCCLDIKRLTVEDIQVMQSLIITYYENTLGAKVIDCLHEICSGGNKMVPEVIENLKPVLCEKFTERVYNEVMYLAIESRSRINNIMPVVYAWPLPEGSNNPLPHFLYTFNDRVAGFEKWLEISAKDLWCWNSVAWGSTKLVIVCGEIGIGTGRFMKDVHVYDTLRREWTVHGVELPSRRHGGVAVIGDSLFIIGGIGAHRTVLYARPIVYDLKQRSYKYIAHFPEPKQCNAVCAHDGIIYAAGQRNIYKYEASRESDGWVRVIQTEISVGHMLSFKEHIYCMQDYALTLFRIRPGYDAHLESIFNFSHPPATLCNLGNRFLYFSRVLCGARDLNIVAEFKALFTDEKPQVIWVQSDPAIMVNDVAGSCGLVLDIPIINVDVPAYHNRYLRKYVPFYQEMIGYK